MSGLIPGISAGPSLQMGAPSDIKPVGQRADFTGQTNFDARIEWHGFRLAWSRAAQCPCAPVNDQTDQADPNCDRCAGAGYMYFNTTDTQDDAVVGELTAVQKKLIARTHGKIIRGLMTGLSTGETPFERLGRLPSGQAVVTVRPNNRIGYLDRFVAIDNYIIHTERLAVPAAPGLPLPLRYLVDGGVNLLSSTTKRYAPDTDFTVVDGELFFAPDSQPEPGTYVTAHYNCHPQYLVVEQPHTSRMTYIPKGKGGLMTPEGTVTQLPLQAVVRLDWLVGRDEAGVAP